MALRNSAVLLVAALAVLVLVCGPSRKDFSGLKAENRRLVAEDSALKAQVAELTAGASALLARARMFYCEKQMDSANVVLSSLLSSFAASPQADSGRRLQEQIRKAQAAPRPTPSSGSEASTGAGPSSGNPGTTVYVADNKSAWEYHRMGCEHLSAYHVSMSRSEAMRRGFKPCSECCPKDYEEQSPVVPPPWITSPRKKPKP